MHTRRESGSSRAVARVVSLVQCSGIGITSSCEKDVMSDSYSIRLQNFRSIRDATVGIAPLTVVYGQNGSGKSSLIYGLLTLRNFLSNPNQNLPSLFSYPAISLGGMEEVAHRHDLKSWTSFSVRVSNPNELSSTFTLALGASGGETRISFEGPVQSKEQAEDHAWAWPKEMALDIGFPYTGNRQVDDGFGVHPDFLTDDYSQGIRLVQGRLIWNGFALGILADDSFRDWTNEVLPIAVRANLPMQLARETGFVPLHRGFSKPTYNFGNFSPLLVNEDEVASYLAAPNLRFQQYEVSRYFEKVTERRVQVQPQVGMSLFAIDSIPGRGGVPASIVNEGFGLNQLLYMLVVCLSPMYKIVAIEEPEIHLHPSMVRRLASVLAEIAVEAGRHLIVSTHSESFVVAILSQIAAGKIRVEDVSFIFAENPGGETSFEKCEATPDGQIEGGLKPFMAGQMEDLAIFLGLDG